MTVFESAHSTPTQSPTRAESSALGDQKFGLIARADVVPRKNFLHFHCPYNRAKPILSSMSWLSSIVRGFIGLVVVRAAIEVCHALGFYPEDWLASLTMGLIGNRAALWTIVIFLTIVIWLALELIARRLIHRRSQQPQQTPEHIPLLEAARIVFDQTKDSTMAEMARRDGSTKLALEWYCRALICVQGDGTTHLMEMTGTRPPSRVQEPIPYDKPPPDLEVRDDIAVLVDRYSKQVVAENLMVPSANIPYAVSFILGLDQSPRGPSNIIVNAS